jgi:3-methyl-2-oxobutanoate hydroxymethyltransferase
MPTSVVSKPGPFLPERVTVTQFQARKSGRKGERRPLVIVTAYDAPQGRLADAAGVDAILVGDSVGMTTLGYDSTLPVTVEDILMHTRAVARGQDARPVCGSPTEAEVTRGARKALLIADLPFGAYGVSVEDGVRAGVRLVSEGGAQAVKMEGAGPLVRETTRRLIDLGVPVMGHLGMTPQSVHRFGGFRLQAKTDAAADALLANAEAMVEAGVFGLVLEVIPSAVAQRVTEALPVPTIGIGAGPDCDGQVQVLHDLVGLTDGPPFKHARRYAELGDLLERAVSEYGADVRARRFPTEENSF